MRTRAALGGFALAASAGWSLTNIGAVADRIVIGLRCRPRRRRSVHDRARADARGDADPRRPAVRPVRRAGRRGGRARRRPRASLAGLARPDPWLAIVVRLVSGVGLAAAFVGGVDYVRATLGTPFAQGLYGAASMASAGGCSGARAALAGVAGAVRRPRLVAAAGLLVIAVAPRAERRANVTLRAVSSTVASFRCVSCTRRRSGSRSSSATGWRRCSSATAASRPKSQASSAALVLFLGVFSRPLGGRLIGRPSVIRASFLVAAAGIGLLVVTRPLPVAVAGATLLGLAAGVPFAGAFAGAQRLRPDAPAAAVVR